ncbi:hypothetical protein FB45DRAFT_170222 [Roridomyces roridus]|uniref:Uncharacterized protein n=1 Tax=Roridomyces roridus TaxID=1738132 RepID=A0AAD7BEX0_9AGAR|nr:hypothetical protein FB45DRAFT_170222 [Roridomyces roridus]
MENGVGEAPLEICSLQQLVSEHSSLQANTHRFSNVNELYSINESPAPIDIRRLEKELPKLRITLDGLVTQGTLSESAKATVSMYAFAALMEKKLAAAKAAAAEEAARKAKESKEKLEDAVSRDSCDVPKTVGSLKAVSAASGAGRRELVHLVDVQKSVQNTLESLNQNEEDEDEYSHRRRRFRRVKLYGENKEDDGLEPEEDSDAKQLKGIWIRRFVRSGKDSL